jgi:hypothetical protein
MKRPNCHNCKHFYVTWDADRRFGCKAMGFKAKNLPSLEVFEADGTDCLSFSEKNLQFSSSHEKKLKSKIGRNLSVKA